MYIDKPRGPNDELPAAGGWWDAGLDRGQTLQPAESPTGAGPPALRLGTGHPLPLGRRLEPLVAQTASGARTVKSAAAAAAAACLSPLSSQRALSRVVLPVVEFALSSLR